MATPLKSFDEIYAERQARTAAKHGMSVDELNDAAENAGTGELEAAPATDTDEPRQADEPQAQDEDLRAEVQRLQSQLSAMMGRVKPEQQRVAALENTMNMMERQYKSQLAEMQQKLDEANNLLEKGKLDDLSYADILSEEERDLIDESQLDIVKKIAAAAAKRFAPSVDVDAKVRAVLEKERENQVIAYRDNILNNPRNPSSRIMALSEDPEFKAWVDANPDVRFTVGAMLNARTTADIDSAFKALDKRIKDFDDQKRTKKGQPQKTDAVTSSLESAMRREANGKSDSQRLDELKAMNKQLKELARSGKRNSQQARDLFDKIQSF